MQTGTIISCCSTSCGAIFGVPLSLGTITGWLITYSYQLDAGGIGQAEVFVGNGSPTALWTSATSTTTVSPNPPGTTNPVSLPCPPQVQKAAFGPSNYV